jgi:peptide/nickel transport system substrate-binding protein
MFHTWHAGAECTVPATQIQLRAGGEADGTWFGWPKLPAVEAAIAEWYDAPDLEAEKAVIRKLNRAALEEVVYAPTGFFLGYQAWRRNITGIQKGPLPFFWGVSKS